MCNANNHRQENNRAYKYTNEFNKLCTKRLHFCPDIGPKYTYYTSCNKTKYNPRIQRFNESQNGLPFVSLWSLLSLPYVSLDLSSRFLHPISSIRSKIVLVKRSCRVSRISLTL